MESGLHPSVPIEIHRNILFAKGCEAVRVGSIMTTLNELSMGQLSMFVANDPYY
jgi:hypothetical protein